MGFESCHPAVNFLFLPLSFTEVASSFTPGCFLAIPAHLRVQHEAERKRAVIPAPSSLLLVVCFCPVLQQLSPFRRRCWKQNFIGNNLTVAKLRVRRHGDGLAAAVVHVAELPVRVVSSDKVLYLFGRNKAHGCRCFSPCCALFRESGHGKKNQPGSEGHAGKQSGQLFRRLVNCLRIFQMLITWMISALALESDSMRSRGSLLRGGRHFPSTASTTGTGRS